MSVIGPIKPYIKYSMDMRQAVPVVAYYCKLFAVQKGLEIIKSDTTGADTSGPKNFLIGEMGDLEAMKKAMPEGTTKEDHRYIVEQFVTSVFTNTDIEERTIETVTKKQAADFNRCSHFIMLLSLFEEAYEEGAWEEKRKYCLFKAGTILKSIKQGVQPPRGNPSDPENDGQRQMPGQKAAKQAPQEEEQKVSSEPPVPDFGFDLPGAPQEQIKPAAFYQPEQPPTQAWNNDPQSHPPSNPPNSFLPPINPPPQQIVQPPAPAFKPTPQPVVAPAPEVNVTKAALKPAKGVQYFADMNEVQKFIRKTQNACTGKSPHVGAEAVAKAISKLSEYTPASGPITAYVVKRDVNHAQLDADMAEANKYVKNAFSEIDFKNMPGCMAALEKAMHLLNRH